MADPMCSVGRRLYDSKNTTRQMTATLAPSPWPAPASPRPGRWRFGHELEGGAPGALQWSLRRNCALAPRHLILVYGSLCLVSLGIALAFWLHGAPAVAAFAGLELLALGVALVVYARHATDRETITLAAHDLAVEHQCGSTVDRARFRAEWVRVEPMAGQGSLVEISGEGRSAFVGRYLRPELRAELASELRSALRSARAGGAQGYGI